MKANALTVNKLNRQELICLVNNRTLFHVSKRDLLLAKIDAAKEKWERLSRINKKYMEESAQLHKRIGESEAKRQDWITAVAVSLQHSNRAEKAYAELDKLWKQLDELDSAQGGTGNV